MIIGSRSGLATMSRVGDRNCWRPPRLLRLWLLWRTKPDALILDVRLSNEDGLLVIDELQNQGAMVPVIVFSSYDNPTYVARTIALGGEDYLLKDASPAQMIDAIQRAVSNQTPPDSSYLRRVQASMQKRKDRADSRDVPLTNRELQVLRHIAFGLSNKEIGSALSISVETVKEHVQNILRNLIRQIVPLQPCGDKISLINV